MERELSPLPYAIDALEPYVTSLTVEVHYERHHRRYLEQLLALLEGRPEQDEPLETLIRTASGDVYRSAAEVWNHTFYWSSLKPGGSEPSGDLLAKIERDFGNLARLEHRFAQAAIGQFGSGWTWLVLDGCHRLRVTSTANADNPLREGGTPLLALDVWEHAYCLDYFHDRKCYVENAIEHLLDWNFAARNLALACPPVGSEPPREERRPSGEEGPRRDGTPRRAPEPCLPGRAGGSLTVRPIF